LGVGACILAALAGVLWLAMKEVKSRAPATAAPAGSADRTTEAALERVRALVEEARSRGVDPNEQSMQQGMQQLRTAAQHLADGHPLDDKGLLPGVAKELESAIRSGRRVARLGSAPDEISLAMTLCQRMRGHCTAEDFADEAPRTASLPPFELDTLTVTNREFADFVAAERYITAAERAGGLYAAKGSTAVFQPRESWRTLRDSLASQVVDPSGLPVRGIDFKAANDYCHSHNKRLPTEDEWEFVARNTDHRIFAWGNEPRLPEAAAPHSLLPVRDQPMTGRFGARGLGDGVLEWVDGGTANERVLRGASWLDTSPVNQRLAGRRLLGPTHAFLDTGFRCARSVDAWPDRTNQRGT
jgi:hypothetical protein